MYAPDVLLGCFTVDSCSEKSTLGCNNSGCPVVDIPGLIVIGVVAIVVALNVGVPQLMFSECWVCCCSPC